MAKKKKRIYKSKGNKILCGVISGFGEYLDVDAVILRAIYVLATAFTGLFPGIIAYIVLCLIIPDK